jgi:hypothetical protein
VWGDFRLPEQCLVGMRAPARASILPRRWTAEARLKFRGRIGLRGSPLMARANGTRSNSSVAVASAHRIRIGVPSARA